MKFVGLQLFAICFSLLGSIGALADCPFKVPAHFGAEGCGENIDGSRFARLPYVWVGAEAHGVFYNDMGLAYVCSMLERTSVRSSNFESAYFEAIQFQDDGSYVAIPAGSDSRRVIELIICE